MKPELEARPADVSASGLGAAAACPARFAFPVAHVRGSDRPYEGSGGGGADAARGTFVHRVFEMRVRGSSLEQALRIASDECRKKRGRAPHHTWKAWASAHDPADLLPSGYSWVPETRWELTIGGLKVGGTPDVVGVRGKEGYVPDWKTTKARDDSAVPASWATARAIWDTHKSVSHRLQMAFHALAALEHIPPLEVVTTDLVYLGPPAAPGQPGQVWGEMRMRVERGGETHVNARRRLEQITGRVAAARELADPHEAAKPGLYCRYCPAGQRNGGPCTRSREVVAPWPGG